MATHSAPTQVARASRLSHLDVRRLDPPPVVIANPHAGQKLGLATNAATADTAVAALRAADLHVDVRFTDSVGHATRLAKGAIEEGRKLIIAAGGDGTVAEVGEAIAGTPVTLGIMPLGSVMNTARTLCIPRAMDQAAQVIANGQVLAMDIGQVNGHNFLEAGGVGLVAGLFGYFDRLDNGASPPRVLTAMWQFLTSFGLPRVGLEVDGAVRWVRAPMVTVSNGPYVGAAYAIAPTAQIDDGLLDVVVYRAASVPRVLLHLALIAGGRHLPPPAEAQTFRVARITIHAARRRLPVHADGAAVGLSPARFEVRPAALRLLVGTPPVGRDCAWTQPSLDAPAPGPNNVPDSAPRWRS